MYRQIKVKHIPFKSIDLTSTNLRDIYAGLFRKIHLFYPQSCYWFCP